MAWLLLSCSALFWAGNFVVGRLVAGEGGPLTLSLWRWGLATLILLPFAWPKLWRQRALIAQHWPLLTFLAIFSVASFNTLLYVGLQTTTATNALIINSSIPVLIIAFGMILLGQRPNLRSVVGILISCLGVVWLVSQGNWQSLISRGISQGDLWILASSVVWAIYSLYLRFRPADLDPIAFLGFTCLVGTAAIAMLRTINPLGEPPLPMETHLLAAVGFFALFPSLGAYLCWNAGLSRVGAARGGQMIHLMPVFGLTLATLFLDERMVSHHWIGAGLIAAGLLIALLPIKGAARA